MLLQGKKVEYLTYNFYKTKEDFDNNNPCKVNKVKDSIVGETLFNIVTFMKGYRTISVEDEEGFLLYTVEDDGNQLNLCKYGKISLEWAKVFKSIVMAAMSILEATGNKDKYVKESLYRVSLAGPDGGHYSLKFKDGSHCSFSIDENFKFSYEDGSITIPEGKIKAVERAMVDIIMSLMYVEEYITGVSYRHVGDEKYIGVLVSYPDGLTLKEKWLYENISNMEDFSDTLGSTDGLKD